LFLFTGPTIVKAQQCGENYHLKFYTASIRYDFLALTLIDQVEILVDLAHLKPVQATLHFGKQGV